MNRRRALMFKKPILPSEYQEVEYLQSTGEQYIDTGVVPSDTVGTILDYYSEFMFANTATDNCVAGVVKSPYGIVLPKCWGNRLETRDMYYNAVDAAIVADTKYTFSAHAEQGEQKYTINGVDYEYTGIATDCDYGDTTFYVFANHVSTIASWYMTGRIYKLWYKENNQLLFNLIPCYRVADSKPGMYDLVSNTFFVNQGTGADFVLPQ